MPPSLLGSFPNLATVSDIPSDLAEPVGAPSGPTDVPSPSDASSLIEAPAEEGPASLVGLPELAAQPVVLGEGEVLLAVEAPWYIGNFDPSIEGCPTISSHGTPVPSQFVDQAISTGAANGVTIVKR